MKSNFIYLKDEKKMVLSRPAWEETLSPKS